jgi:hypothetical protein
MFAFLQRRSVRICRVVFRWVRITAWLIILLCVMAGAYLHWHGLPDFLKRPILQHLRDRGYDAEFSSMRLGWGPSVIVDNGTFQRLSKQPEARLTAARADLEMTLLDLARAKVALKSFEVYDGKLQFPTVGQSNAALSFENIHLELMFGASNLVRLTNTMASFHGVHLNVDGELNHAEGVREWTALSLGRSKTSWQALLARLTDVVDQIHFAQTPRVDLDFDGDARDIDSLRANLSVIAPDVSTPWGEGRRIRFAAACAHLLSTNQPMIRLELSEDETATPWAQGSAIELTAFCSRDADFNINAVTKFSSDEFDATWATNHVKTKKLEWDGTAGLNGTNFHLMRAQGSVRSTRVESTWGSAEDLRATVTGETNDPPIKVAPDWGIWAKLARYRLDWTMAGTNIETPKLELHSVFARGNWKAPIASVSQLECSLYDGNVSGDVRLDVGTREATVNARSSFDGRRVAQLLTPAAQHWLSQFDWKATPDVSAALRLILPAWTNRHPNWGAEIRPTLEIDGAFDAPHGGSFRGVAVDSAKSRFGYTNRVWTLPGLVASRPDGNVLFSYAGSDATHEYHFDVESAMDPQVAKALLPAAQQHWFDEVKFSTPPRIQGEIWGRWRAPDSIGVRAHVEATNFVAHGEKVDFLAADLDYTNRFLRVRDAKMAEGTQQVTAGGAEADLTSKKIEVTNVVSTLDADFVRRVSAPRMPKFLQFIEFDKPPTVQASGSFEIGNPLVTDLRFSVEGRGFHYTNLEADKISGGVRWRGRNVLITNVQASVYNTGSLVGWCMFDYVPKQGTDFRCNFSAKDVDLALLAMGLTGRSNKLEGMLDGTLVMVEGNSTNKRSWNGFGDAHVHNALLWDIPVFGIFSPVLNAFSAGAGNSQAHEASATYAITNGVLLTDDLVVHSTGFRLNYSGTVDGVTKQVDARAEAELLRDTRVFGPLLSALFSPLSRLFEYKVTGTLHNPKMSPVYIPEPFMLLLRPFHTLKTLGESVVGSESSEASTNSVPIKK